MLHNKHLSVVSDLCIAVYFPIKVLKKDNINTMSEFHSILKELNEL